MGMGGNGKPPFLMGMGITCTPMGIYSHIFFGAFSKLLVLSLAVATRQMPMPCVPSLPTTGTMCLGA